MIKAYCVHDGRTVDYDWQTDLVWAESASKAKALAVRESPWGYQHNDCWTFLRAYRVPQYDSFATEPRLLDDNAELVAAGFPKFWRDEE